MQQKHKVNLILLSIFLVILLSFGWFLAAYLLKNKIHNFSISLVKKGVDFSPESMQIKGFPFNFRVVLPAQELNIVWKDKNLKINFPEFLLKTGMTLKNSTLDFGEQFLAFNDKNEKIIVNLAEKSQMQINFAQTPWFFLFKKDWRDLYEILDLLHIQFQDLFFEKDGQNALKVENFDWQLKNSVLDGRKTKKIIGQTTMNLGDKSIKQDADLEYYKTDKKINFAIYNLKNLIGDSEITIKGKGSLGQKNALQGEYVISWKNVDDILRDSTLFNDEKFAQQKEILDKILQIADLIEQNQEQKSLKISIDKDNKIKINDIELDNFVQNIAGLNEKIEQLQTAMLDNFSKHNLQLKDKKDD